MPLQRFARGLTKLHLLVLVVLLVAVVFTVQLVWQTDRMGDNDDDATVNRKLRSHYNYDSHDVSKGDQQPPNKSAYVHYDRSTPLIWIGGIPRSGTTLARAMLDAHPSIRCGEETRVIPRILGMHAHMIKSQAEMTRLVEAKVTEDVLNDALGAYILSIIAKHGETASRLCNKDPFALRSLSRLLKIFPNSKFLLMVRDGRATAHSIISRKVTIKGFDVKTYRGALRDWNRAIENMYNQCLAAGKHKCMPVYYEKLVLHPAAEMKKVLRFLNVPWNDIVLHHERVIGKNGGVSLSKKELSTDQVNKPVNTGALSKWVGHIPADVKQDMAVIAPMLQRLGYDPNAFPPNYGTADKVVMKQSAEIRLTEKLKLLKDREKSQAVTRNQVMTNSAEVAKNNVV